LELEGQEVLRLLLILPLEMLEPPVELLLLAHGLVLQGAVAAAVELSQDLLQLEQLALKPLTPA
jgi:hypothetical protein